MTVANVPQFLIPSAPGQLCNFYGDAAGGLASPSQPTVTASAGSTNLPAGTYTFVITYTSRRGETTPSPSQSVTITAGQQVTISDPGTSPDSGLAWTTKYYLTAAPTGVNLGYIGSVNLAGLSLVLNSKTQGNGVQPPTSNTTDDGIFLKVRYSNPNQSS